MLGLAMDTLWPTDCEQIEISTSLQSACATWLGSYALRSAIKRVSLKGPLPLQPGPQRKHVQQNELPPETQSQAQRTRSLNQTRADQLHRTGM